MLTIISGLSEHGYSTQISRLADLMAKCYDYINDPTKTLHCPHPADTHHNHFLDFTLLLPWDHQLTGSISSEEFKNCHTDSDANCNHNEG
jgi:hypothetical protein